jgi:hypothetical protein
VHLIPGRARPIREELSMPRTCSICVHRDRDAIEHVVVSGGSLRADLDRAAGLRERLEGLYIRSERIPAEAESAGATTCP